MCRRKYTAEETLLMNNIRKSNERCYYCGCGVKESKRTVDHKTPVSRGGETIAENLVMSCERCNNEKAFLTEEEYMEYKKVADIKVSESTAVIALTAIINSCKDVEPSDIKEKNILNSINNEISEIELIIRDSKLSASDGYKLCKMLQDNLLEREVVKKNIKNIQSVKQQIGNTKKCIEDKLENIKKRIRNDYRNEYISTKRITLIENA